MQSNIDASFQALDAEAMRKPGFLGRGIRRAKKAYLGRCGLQTCRRAALHYTLSLDLEEASELLSNNAPPHPKRQAQVLAQP